MKLEDNKLSFFEEKIGKKETTASRKEIIPALL